MTIPYEGSSAVMTPFVMSSGAASWSESEGTGGSGFESRIRVGACGIHGTNAFFVRKTFSAILFRTDPVSAWRPHSAVAGILQSPAET